MNAKRLAPLVLALLCASAGAQQMYKWVAPDGTVSYTDKPPPSTATKVEKKSFGGTSSNDDLPYELANAAKSNPVVLYTRADCEPCDLGRKLLNDRGIPFAEKTVNSNDDVNQLTKLNGSTGLPALAVGKNKQTGFFPDQWQSALTTANYPISNKMPKSHKNPPAEPLVAAAPKAEEKAAPSPTPTPTPAPAPAQQPASSQPGFHF